MVIIFNVYIIIFIKVDLFFIVFIKDNVCFIGNDDIIV